MVSVGKATLCQNCFCLPSEKGSTLTGKNVSIFFPFRENPFSEGDCCIEMQTGSHKSYFPC